jgi:hypothetical protein
VLLYTLAIKEFILAIHTMIDLETLDTKPSSTILTLGAVTFNPFMFNEPTNELYIKLDIDEQDKLGRTTSESTLQWWMKQDAKIQEEAFSEDDRVSITQTLAQLSKYLINADVIWAHSYGFDMTILEDLYRQMKLPVPWNFWQIRDSRTLLALLPEDPRKSMQTDLHNALADAYYQAKAVQIAYDRLGVKK